MPIKLKRLLFGAGITHGALAAEIGKHGEPSVSRTAVSLLINWGYYPKTVAEGEFRQQVEAALIRLGVSPDQLPPIWQAENDDQARDRYAKPFGVFAAGSERPARPNDNDDIDPLEPEMLSPAAKRHFQLFRDPFKDDVAEPADVFLSADQRYVAEAMYQTARHGGFVAVVGESGSGKSTLRKMLIERIREQPVRLIFPRVIDKSRLSTGNICQAIINDLAPGQTVRASLEAQARQVEAVLLTSARADNAHVLLIEEAHDLSIATLKYLKRFYELEDGFRKLLSIILVGQPELRHKLDENRHPEAREVIRRIEIAELAPLDNHLQDYVAHKFRRAGVEVSSVLDAGAFDAIRVRLTRQRPGVREVLSQLYPLVVNNLVTKAMNRAADLGVPQITADLVREV